jgi:hypothetical protein
MVHVPAVRPEPEMDPMPFTQGIPLGLAPEGRNAGSPGLRPWEPRPPFLPLAPEGRNEQVTRITRRTESPRRLEASSGSFRPYGA